MNVEFELDDPHPSEVADRLRGLSNMMERGANEYGEEIALRVLADARRDAPVDEGRLQNDIDYEVRTHGNVLVITVGNNVFYARFQEILNPYLRPAWSSNEAKIGEILTEFVANEMEDALE